MEGEKTKRPRSVLQQEQLAKARVRALEVRKERAVERNVEKPKAEVAEPVIEKPVEAVIETPPAREPEPKMATSLPSPVKQEVPEELKSLRFHNGTLMFYE